MTSQVTFRTLDDAVIEAYFKVVNPLDKAGAYGIPGGQGDDYCRLGGVVYKYYGVADGMTKQILTTWGLVG